MLGFKENLILVIIFGALLFAAAFIVSIIKKRKSTSDGDGKLSAAAPDTDKGRKPIKISLPISGRIIPLSEIEDPAFSSGALGDGCAVIPSEGRVFSPVNGRIVVMPGSKHAVGIESIDGCNILIHVGRDTVSLGGRHFTSYCSVGDNVSAGDLLLVFDDEKLSREGYDIKTPILISESEKYEPFSPLCKDRAKSGDALFELYKKE